jgi:hypothetical protein
VEGLLHVGRGVILVIEHLREALRVPQIWWSQSTHVVTLLLEPVQWLLSTLVALGIIPGAPKRMSMTLQEQEGLGRYLTGTTGFMMGTLDVEPVTLHRKPFMNTASRMNDVSHITLADLLTLGRTAVLGMDPMPCTDAAALGARWHILRNCEGGVEFPNTCMVNAEDGQIFGLDAVHVGGVCNGESTTPHVIEALGRINERFRIAPTKLRNSRWLK